MKEKILAYYKRYFVYTKEFFKIAEKKNQSWMILALTLVAFIGFGELFILIKGYTSTEILWLYSSVMSSCGSIFALALVVLRKIHSKKSFYVSAFICRFSFFIVLAVETYVAFFYIRNLTGILGWSIICLFALLIFDFEPPLFSSFILTAVISVYFFGKLKGDQATGLVFLGIIYCNLSFIVRKIKIDELRRKEEKRKKIDQLQTKTIGAFADMVEARDKFSGEHVKRTAEYVGMISRQLVKDGKYTEILTNQYIDLLIKAAPLHDLGKLYVPDDILNKPAKLTEDEYAKIKRHSADGSSIIEKTLTSIEEKDFLQVAKEMALNHHERWDGNGYPANKKGMEIPLCARIMAVADVFDALSSKRQYKEALPLEEVLEIMQNERGGQFEPDIVDALVECKRA